MTDLEELTEWRARAAGRPVKMVFGCMRMEMEE
jgi:hypothetical protein